MLEHITTAPLKVDPVLFRPSAITDETRAVNAALEAAIAAAPSLLEVGPQVIRAARKAGEGLLGYQPASPRAKNLTARALDREVQVRLFRPEGPCTGAVLHIHGGGHVLGSATAQDQTLQNLADRLSVGVVSVDYRLAPEAPYPAGPDDCEVAALWLAKEAPTLFGTDRLVITGESAGAHLSVVTLLRLRDRHGVMPFHGAALVYGQFDLSGTPSVRHWGERNLVLSTPIIRWFNDQFLPNTDYQHPRRCDPDISPLYADVSGLCPALFTVGTLDPLIDDTLFMAQRWSMAGNGAALDIYPGGVHVFNMVPELTIGTQANGRIEDFMRQALGPPSVPPRSRVGSM